MENPITKHIPQPSQNQYIPLKYFKELIGDLSPSPYQSKFSFFKLLEELRLKSNALKQSTLSETVAELEKMEAQLQERPSDWEALFQTTDFEALMIHIFPSFFHKGQMGFIKGPFEKHQFRFRTKAFQEIMANENREVKLDGHKFLNADSANILLAGITVLNTFYDQKIEFFAAEKITLRDPSNKMERHYKFNVQFDYLEVKALKSLMKLSQKKIHELLNNLNDEELWLKYIPPENFVFEGFIIGHISDVTRSEILSIVKDMAANEGGKNGHESDLNYLERLIQSFLNMQEVRLGALQTVDGPWIENITWCLLRKHDTFMVEKSLSDPQSAYGRVLQKLEPFIIEDLQQRTPLSPLEKALVVEGVRSLLLVPLKNDEGRVTSIFELGSHKPFRFNQLTLMQLQEFISLFEMGSNKFIQEMDNAIRLTIQQEFTSIHPSVEWKFRHVAGKYFRERIIEEKQSSLDPIVFPSVYPLYGQADIVSSSQQRNNSIQTDLIDNLERLHQLLTTCRQKVRFHLFDVYADKVEIHLKRLKKGAFVSSDESVIVELLTEQIHPLIRKIKPRFSQLPDKLIDNYFNALDPELNIIYQQRKAYEDSVSQLNQAISHYLLQEEEKMQQILPHYFEKFQTDGVEYNLYLGQSLLEKGDFHPFYLQDFRLWQLILMCEITRLVDRQSKELPVPLTTAQLVFVYNSPLSIRFEMDEKQFDVDGAYNVRYEIIKKRIDKAYIKGTDERLTQAGKIAIVWLQEKDRQEYQEYIDHLVRNGYITPEIEDLDLEKMQGVEGLKAVRITVLP